MPKMRKRRLLLAATALTTVLGACEKRQPIKYANEKGSRYPMAPLDAGTDAPPDGGEAPPTPGVEPKQE